MFIRDKDYKKLIHTTISLHVLTSAEAKETANRLSPPDGPVASISDHEKFLKKFSGRVLHPNHVIIVDVK